ncbi:MarR family transcriptional regulator [Psychrobacillus sp. FJAT-51614]|uniref:MarR family transcriptional regulator n=1 Tax=Psychrobacillus mangrovi TaxID=3117745 RepID=A0ABU8F9M0_9BACI
MKELGEVLNLDTGTLSPLLRRMETAGLIELAVTQWTNAS